MLTRVQHGEVERRVREVVEAVLEVLSGRERGALATVVRTSGSTPRSTVGGGAIEHAVLDALHETLRTGESCTIAHDLGFDLGMCCGGRMEVFVEAIEPSPRLWLIGAGHVARPTAALAKTVGFDVVVVDDREDLNSEERFPGCRIELEDPVSLLRRTTLGDCDWVLIVTHDHGLDEKALGLCMQQQPRYVGLVASRRKAFRLVQRIAARGGSVDLDRLYAPVGLDVGAATPEEMAVSIVGELIAIRHGKDAEHLRALGDPRLARTLEEALR
jgi:xanthine dehydrogenase accessory factor